MSIRSVTTEQPEKTSSPSVSSAGPTKRRWGAGGRFKHLREKVTTRHGWVGDYDYAWLCMPTAPWRRSRAKQTRTGPPFYALDSELPIILAAASGLQHALAMLAGLITPPIIFANALSLDSATSAYMISASLIGCGILSLVQMSRLRLFGNYYLGTGLISVVGTSFATLSTANAIFNTMYADGTCPSTTAADGTVTRGACPDAYGMVLGTSMICAFLEIGMSFVSPRILKRVFPPMVTGTVIVMIGASLIGSSGIPNWGGGSNDCSGRPASGFFQLCPNIAAPRPLPWGSPEFIGLGFLSFVSIILTELFGSPFLKNISVIVGLAVGCIVAGAAGYIDGSSITTAPAITFLWVHTFKIRVYAPAILPMLAVYVSLAMEAIGDITASAEVSRVSVVGEEFDSRIQGGVLSDGIGGFLSALFTVTPLSIFAQNNGVIAITRCANRTAGRFCCVFLILFGVLGKISGVFLAIPNPVLGGVTTFLFATVATSGVRVLSYNRFTRRDRFVLAAAFSFGIGDLLVPTIFTHLFDGVRSPNKGLQGLFDSITIVLSTPFLMAGLVALVLNLILPQDDADGDDDDVVEVVDVEAQPHSKEKELHN
ncbi:Xanthine/uracil permease [Trametes versicolor FP-101664 SS1]|uniref:Xanthine/uracil permease n=1 Tax=Trametes versicolor (strain FP-101664) TaxID=717944 RepID=UPI0004622AAB|nr:Xanthine/uracil permease [Trametes versicolor FP-101664 SS1]EIW61252.1 Xanthine/uracil permease [Trametes versicolor FP-101664 SS1]